MRLSKKQWLSVREEALFVVCKWTGRTFFLRTGTRS